MATTKAERKLVELFLKTVGAGLGLYDRSVREFKPNLESEGVYQTNLEIVRQALKEGWSAAELEDHICHRYKQGDRSALLSEILPKKRKSDQIGEEDNLLEDGVAYRHPSLLTWTGRPVYRVEGDTMIPVHRGALARKSVFTLRELVAYYFSRLQIPQDARRHNKAVGQMRWLLSQNSLDEILHAIDIAAAENRDASVFELSNYMSQARQEVERCQARQSEA